MDGLTLLISGFTLLLGFLLGWLVEWRMDSVHWSKHTAQFGKRELIRRARAEEEILNVQLQADRQMAEMRRQFEAQLTETRAQAEDQVAAAYAKAETLITSLKSDYRSHETSRLREYEQSLADIRAHYEVQLGPRQDNQHKYDQTPLAR